jgi:hypothetical protein
MKLCPPLLLMLALVLFVQSSMAGEGKYAWSSYVQGEQVQYGIADTDDRTLWIGCDAKGLLQIGGPTPERVAEGQKIEVSFSSPALTGVEILNGQATERGDGMNFVVPATERGLVIDNLLRGMPVKVSTGSATWIVPGNGAAETIGPLLAACSLKKKHPLQ